MIDVDNSIAKNIADFSFLGINGISLTHVFVFHVQEQRDWCYVMMLVKSAGYVRSIHILEHMVERVLLSEALKCVFGGIVTCFCTTKIFYLQLPCALSIR